MTRILFISEVYQTDSDFKPGAAPYSSKNVVWEMFANLHYKNEDDALFGRYSRHDAIVDLTSSTLLTILLWKKSLLHSV